MMCYCGKKLPKPRKTPFVFYCSCGRKWIWKIRSKRYVFAGYWRDKR